jgi:gliding motility-associated lipoprotein GldD
MSIIVTACNQDYVPKPRSHFRIDLPEKSWQKFDTTFPYAFEYPSYAVIHYQNDTSSNPYWINIEFPRYKGTCYLSYSNPGSNLNDYLEESREMAMKHMQKSNGIDEYIINRPEARVFGTVFEISGNDAASTYQFYLTDSISNFIRGALYFNIVPNNDSLSPVIAFIKKDVDHFIETLQWKNGVIKKRK